MYLSTGNQRQLITLCVLYQADEGHTSELGQPNLQHRHQTSQGSTMKRGEKRYVQKRIFFFPFLQQLYFITQDGQENLKNTVFKIKIHFLAVMLGFCISCLCINCCQTQDVRSIWQLYTSPAAKCFLKIQGLRY